MISTQTFIDLRRLASEITTEFFLGALYVEEAALFDGLPMRSDCLGVAIHPLAVTTDFKDRIGPNWHGHAPLIVLYEEAIRKDYQAEYFEMGIVQTFIHELGHATIVALPPTARSDSLPEVSAEVRAAEREVLTKRLEIPEPKQGSEASPHGWRFLRRCCHLWYRASLAGWSIDPHGILGSAYEFGPQLPFWICELMPELATMTKAKFSAIEASEPPSGFTRMWQRYLQFHETRA